MTNPSVREVGPSQYRRSPRARLWKILVAGGVKSAGDASDLLASRPEAELMEWQILLIDALVGGLAGGLGALLTRKLPANQKLGRSIISVALVIGGITAANRLIAPRLRAARDNSDVVKVGRQAFGSEQAARLYAASLTPILRDPKFRERLTAARKVPLGTAAQEADPSVDGVAVGMTTQLVAKGMARLTDVDQETFAALKVALAATSTELCAAFWTGQIRAEEMSAAMRQLSEEQKAAWIRISMEALTRELHATAPATAPAPEVNEAALKTLQEALSPDEKATFERATQAGASVSPADACAAFRLIMSRGKTLPPAVRATLVRMMVVAPEGG
jgi:hypothetical protein